LHLIVSFPSFDVNIIVDVSCGVSVFSGRWFSTVFLTVPVLVPLKGSVARSFFASGFCPPSNAIMHPSFSFSLS
jgi:hypothetical protein